MKKIPCENCLILPICINKEVLNCKLLLDYLDQYKKSTYPEWTNALQIMRETLKGSWYAEGINGKTNKVKKNIPKKDGKWTMDAEGV